MTIWPLELKFAQGKGGGGEGAATVKEGGQK